MKKSSSDETNFLISIKNNNLPYLAADLGIYHFASALNLSLLLHLLHLLLSYFLLVPKTLTALWDVWKPVHIQRST